jgi:HK97 family phage major capsid protein
MPTTVMDRNKKPMASKDAAIKDLLEKKEQAAALVEQSEELYKLAEADGRDLTTEEEDQITAWLSESDALRNEFAQQSEERRRATIRQAIDLGQEKQAAVPDPGSMLNTGRLRYVTHMQPRWQDDPQRGFTQGSGEFYSAVAAVGMPGGLLDERLQKLRLESAAMGMNQGVGAEGGFLVPPSFRTEIWDRMTQQIDNLLNLTDQYTVVGESLTMPAVAETSRATGSRYGGIRGYWIAEAEEKQPSHPRFRQMRLEPQELAVLVYVTDKLLRNAPALEQFVRRAASEEILFLVNDSIINGTGVGQPLGILRSSGLVVVPAEGGQTADTIVLENINAMYSRMHARARPGAVWFVNQETEAQLESLSSVNGTAGFPVYLPQGPGGPTITESPNARLKGRPVMPVEYMPALGELGDIVFANLGYYATGVKGAIRDDMSIHVRFQYDETAFRFVFEVDGQPWINAPITPYRGTSTLSAFVALAPR